MTRRFRRSVRPTLERVESRNLMSVTAIPYAAPKAVSTARLVALASNVGDTASQQTPMPPVVPGQGQPTPREQARTAFRGTFTGPVYYGPGRYTDQSRIIYFRGTGTSSHFLHGDYQMALVFPTDPAAPITGAAYLQDKNNNSGGVVGFDLTADSTSLDRRGRPTRATFVSDPNIYGGIFFLDSSQGSVKIAYHGGTASAAFQGHVYTSGITNPLTNADLISRGGRVTQRS
ncbi:MAG: hypothetical protein JWN86_323 [Planctomycetota bacterium]|nr:hypothetical protein [Planctomycetota bacterium]